MKKLISWFFPMLMAVLMLCGTRLYPPIFNGTNRWLLVLIAFLLALVSPYFKMVRKTPLFRVLILYLFWCLLTVTWSEIQILSFYKVLALIMVTIGMLSLGFNWIMSRKHLNEALYAFKWVAGASMIVALSGRVGQGLLEKGSNYYQGLTGNPNYLGWMMAVSIPIVLWHAFDSSKKKNHRLFSFSLLGVYTYYLLVSQSRASMLFVFCTILGFFAASDLGKKTKLAGFAIFLVAAAFLTVPNLSDLVYEKFILKGRNYYNITQSFEGSRQHIFKLSYQAAIQGDISGAGVGISIGSNPYRYYGGLSSVGYGREKGNSVLAIIEETGFIGFGIVTWILYIFLSTALRAYKRTKAREDRLLVGTLTAFMLGFLVHANFEAWWVAPGSAESLFFWGLAGLSYAVNVVILSGTYDSRAS